MATIRTDSGKIADISSDFIRMSNDALKNAQTVSGARDKLDSAVKSRSNINAQLTNIQTTLEEIANGLQQACIIATNSAEAYAKASQKASSDITEGGKLKSGSGRGSSGGSGSNSSSNSSPNSSPNSNSNSNSNSNPKSNPNSSPNSNPNSNTNSSPNSNPNSSPNSNPNSGSNSNPNSSPNSNPNSGSNSSPGSDSNSNSDPNTGTGPAQSDTNNINLTPDDLKTVAISAATSVATQMARPVIEKLANSTNIKGGSDSARAQADISAFEANASFDNGDVRGSADLKVGHLNADASADYVFDPANGDIAAKAKAEASATLLEASARLETDYSSTGASAEIGKVKADASGEASLMENGSINPKLNAQANAEATALSGKVDSEVHAGDYRVATSAEGKVATANANANVTMDAQKGEFAAGAGGFASVASGTVSTEGDIGLLKGGIKATGHAASVGGKMGASYKDGMMSVNLGGAAVVGADVQLSVGLGSGAGKAGKVANDIVGNAAAAASTAIATPINKIASIGKSLFGIGAK